MSMQVALEAHYLPSIPVGSKVFDGLKWYTVFIHPSYEDAFYFWVEVAAEADNELTWEYAYCAAHHVVDSMQKNFVVENDLSPNMPVDARRILEWREPYKTVIAATWKTWDYWKPKSPYKLKAQP